MDRDDAQGRERQAMTVGPSVVGTACGDYRKSYLGARWRVRYWRPLEDGNIAH